MGGKCVEARAESAGAREKSLNPEQAEKAGEALKYSNAEQTKIIIHKLDLKKRIKSHK